ncbi:MAG TPA: glycosyltransferase family 2 protein [Acidobacteriaceae bacterium]|nr:glycosyltransferase family 2 protein [Acidobacteriaceae bacterium]
MHWFLLSATTVSSVILAVWTQRAVAAQRHLPHIPNLLDPRYDPAAAPSAPPDRPQITVVVPARNESAAIEATLRSLLAQTIPLEILAVDDRSTDATRAIMDRVAAGPRPSGKVLSVIHVSSLPSGWMGKNHAIALSARQTGTPWLLFTDGDVVFQPDTLERALRFADDVRADHIVLLPTLTLKTPGERMMAAIFQSLTLLAWRPWKVADPKATRESIGTGAFNLVRAETYRAIGGFEKFPMEILEDLRLGREIKHHGYRQHMVLGRDLIRLHWAAGAMGMVNNLTKNIYATFRFNPILLLGAWLALLVFGGVPLAGLFTPSVVIRITSVLSLLMIALLYQQASRYYNRISLAWVFTFPVALALVLYAMLRSMFITLRTGGVTWRGTFYPLRELRRNLGPLR